MNRYDTAIEMTDLTVAYREKPVLWDVDLDVPQGVLMAILGPNGAGKSTLIKTILGLVEPAAGQVRIYGRSYEEQRRLVGYVPQLGSVDWDFPTNALDVVMMGLYSKIGWLRRPGREERELAMESLHKVGMADFDVGQFLVLFLELSGDLDRADPDGPVIGPARHARWRQLVGAASLIPFDVGIIPIVHGSGLADFLVEP